MLGQEVSPAIKGENQEAGKQTQISNGKAIIHIQVSKTLSYMQRPSAVNNGGKRPH
jgi:hypothetical protein